MVIAFIADEASDSSCALLHVYFPTLCCAEQRHGTEVVAIQANFAYGAQVFEEIEETISAYQVGILGDLNAFTLKVL